VKIIEKRLIEEIENTKKTPLQAIVATRNENKSRRVFTAS
jgi:hypothetical protein